MGKELTAQNAPGISASLSGRRWIWNEPEARIGQAIAQRFGLPEIVGRLLASRGVKPEGAGQFLEPTLRALMPDPSCMMDMDRAAARLAKAVQNQETVGIFGDYDVDGACSCAIITLLLRRLGCTAIPYIPDRMTEGYGPNVNALSGLVDRGASLIVCVDCGTSAAEILETMVGRAEVIVLDHHAAQGTLPNIIAVVNPNRPDCISGLRMLCAGGVAFMAAVATQRHLRKFGFFKNGEEPDLKELLDLVALSTVCDVMPLVGLNRAFVVAGLKVMERRARPGVAALLDVAHITERLSAMTLGWSLGPRINAAGRISESDLGFRLLLSDDELEARELALQLDSINNTRQDVEADILEDAMRQAADQIANGRACVLVSSTKWHAGVVGIVAGRIKERFNRPACVAAISDGLAKGSGRSVLGLDLGAAVMAARAHGLLISGGGHGMAAGFGLQVADMDRFHAFLDERLAVASMLPQAADLVVDGAISVAGCTLDLATQLGRLAPFGSGNAEPTLVLSRVRVAQTERIGKEGKTLRVMLEGEGGGSRLKGLLFRAGNTNLAQTMSSRDGTVLNVAGHLRAESWNGRVSAGFIIVDAALEAEA